MAVERKIVKFVFGNHKHWAGMVWEWGEDTLANSTRALARVVEETGLKGGLNFDGKGIEQLATFDQQSVSQLRSMLSQNQIELWGCSYTQPYGGLIGHESNIAQRLLGIDAFERVLGTRPYIFAEEEFDFFPQMPQLLRLLGYKGALLFPQHTWHTPTFTKETEPRIAWVGVDGSSIAAIPFSERCLMRGIPTAEAALKEPLFSEAERPLMITWLEMLDKPNWMWRTDFVIEHLLALQALPEIEIEPTLLQDELSDGPGGLPERAYSLDDCFHGVSAGKNGDGLPRLWRTAEAAILEAEFLATWCSYLGQPYPQFDSYPMWTLQEAWRNLCLSQAHDAYECEGFTHFAGHRFAQLAIMLARDVSERCRTRLGEKQAPDRPAHASAFGGPSEARAVVALPHETPVGDEDWLIDISMEEGHVTSLRADGSELLGAPVGMPAGWTASGKPNRVERDGAVFITTPITGQGATGVLKWRIVSEQRFARGQLVLDYQERPNAGIAHSTMLPVRTPEAVERMLVDSPFAVLETKPYGKWPHMQPTGHWLTSPQVAEWIEKPITYLSFIALKWQDSAIQYISRQNLLALAQPNGFDAVIFGYDAWDQDNWTRQATIDFAFAPASGLTRRQLLEQAEHAWFPTRTHHKGRSFYSHDGPAFITAVRKRGEELEVRLFEAEGEGGLCTIDFAWRIESACKVGLRDGEVIGGCEVDGATVRFPLRPHEIVTLRVLFDGMRTEYLDIDKHRGVWVGPPPADSSAG